MNQYIWRAHQRHATADCHRLFFFTPMSITERELPIHSGQKHVGALLGVDAVDAMAADVQGGTAVLAGVAVDIKRQATENRILGLKGRLAVSPCLGTRFLSSYLVSRSFWPSSVPLFTSS